MLLMTHLHSRKLSHTGMKNALLIRHVMLTAVNILTWGWRGSLSHSLSWHMYIFMAVNISHGVWLSIVGCTPVLVSYLYVTYSFLGHWICISVDIS